MTSKEIANLFSSPSPSHYFYLFSSHSSVTLLRTEKIINCFTLIVQLISLKKLFKNVSYSKEQLLVLSEKNMLIISLMNRGFTTLVYELEPKGEFNNLIRHIFKRIISIIL